MDILSDKRTDRLLKVEAQVPVAPKPPTTESDADGEGGDEPEIF